MSEIAAFVLTALAAVVVVLTRLRLRRSHAGLPLAAHTWVGGAAIVLWALFLAFPEHDPLGGALIGVIALGGWWVTVIAGLFILVRWLPSRSRGKRAADTGGAVDTWTAGPGLSVLGHVGMLLGVLWFTYAYVFSVV